MLCHASAVFLVVLFIATSSSSCPATECLDDEACRRLSQDILQPMRKQKAAQACTDFYSYVCDPWSKTITIPKDRVQVSALTIRQDRMEKELISLLEKKNGPSEPRAIRMVKSYYRSCVDTEEQHRTGGDVVKKVLGELGGWPMIDQNSTVRMEDTLGQIKRNYAISVLFDLSVGLDAGSKTGNRVLFISEGSLPLNPAEIYLMPIFKLNRVAYVNFIRKVAHQTARTFGTEIANDFEIQLDELMKFETAIAAAKQPVDHRGGPKTIRGFKRGEIDKQYTEFEWSAYIEHFLTEDLMEDHFFIAKPNYFNITMQLLKNTTEQTIRNHAIWQLMYFLATSGINQDFDKIVTKFMSAYTTRSAWIERSHQCLHGIRSNGYLAWALSALYVRDRELNQDRTAVRTMFLELVEQAAARVERAEWMDRATKNEAREKVDSLLAQISHPDWLNQDTALDETFAGLNISDTQSYLEMYRELRSWVLQKELRRASEKRNRTTTYQIHPVVTNAYYHYLHNILSIPAGLIGSPVYERNFPPVFNYGSLGGVIAHEISHTMDDTGSFYDKVGRSRNWWSKSSRTEHNKRIDCLIEKYNDIYVDELQTHVNGALTIAENVADLGSIHIAYGAFEKAVGDCKDKPIAEEYTAEQLFFIGYARFWCSKRTYAHAASMIRTDTHAPARLRVNMSLKTIEAFGRAFNCSADDEMRMNELDRCTIWK